MESEQRDKSDLNSEASCLPTVLLRVASAGRAHNFLAVAVQTRLAVVLDGPLAACDVEHELLLLVPTVSLLVLIGIIHLHFSSKLV